MSGAILLPLQCGKDWDSNGQGRDFWLEGAVSGQDPRKAAYDLRTRCYDLVLATLSAFDERLDKATNEAAGVYM